jgi:hypothetical protein
MKFTTVYIFRLIAVIVCLVCISFSVIAADTTVTTVAPGFVHYAIFDPSGPFNIRILEIDLSVPDNAIATVLANDVLAEGFERTSGMSKRKTGSGNIVIGAINGDFYGISDPSNPYGFLGNSMITAGEFVFGRTHIRSSFGAVDEIKPALDVLNFTGSLATASNQMTSITGVNSQRFTNSLILYNSFFGSSTRTNEYGTEIKLQSLSELSVNQSLLFEVAEKIQNEGNMSISQGDYILSGYGTAQSFLDQHLEVGDTITIVLGTTPNVGSLTALIGGVPRLVTNGTRPESLVGVEGVNDSFVNTRHPRTAVGFNEDSTIVYFVTVDGRQPELSAGMSLQELADLLISIGVYHGVNLDGGGSTTMVIHDLVVNSPSDPGGERYVANALLAVRKVEIDEPDIPILLHPEQGALDQRDTVLFVWNRSELAATYDIQLSPDPAFDEPLVYMTILIDTTFIFTGMEGQHEYYWRVRSRNAAGESEFSDVFSFTTGFPEVPELVYPQHGMVGIPVTPVLRWLSVESATEYRVQLARGRTIVLETTLLDTIVAGDTTLTLPVLDNNRIYYWRVNALNSYGASGWSDVWGFRTEDVTSVEEIEENIPQRYVLMQNYPNPFNPSTSIVYGVPYSSTVDINIYNIAGQKVAALISSRRPAGWYHVNWYAGMEPSGVYFYRFMADGIILDTKRMVLVK